MRLSLRLSCLLLVLSASFFGVESQADAGELLRPFTYASAAASEPATTPEPSVSTPRVPYGQEGHTSLTIGAGVGIGGVGATAAYNGFLSVDRFMVDQFQASIEFGGWFFDQDADNAVGATANLVFRWHFIQHETWSIFTDAGAGLLFASADVPRGGTQVNFSVRAGLGFTAQLFESQNRLIGGVRWQHFSNARVTGADSNPGTDMPVLYLGVTFPL